MLVADEDREALASTEEVLHTLGHEVIGYAIEVREAIERIAAEDPDVAVAVLHGDTQHALDLIDELSEVTRGPVLAVIDGDDPAFVAAAAERERLEEQVDQLEGALARRAVTERAKGILMERHDLGERAAFERVRSCARSHQRTSCRSPKPSPSAISHLTSSGNAPWGRRSCSTGGARRVTGIDAPGRGEGGRGMSITTILITVVVAVLVYVILAAFTTSLVAIVGAVLVLIAGIGTGGSFARRRV